MTRDLDFETFESGQLSRAFDGLSGGNLRAGVLYTASRQAPVGVVRELAHEHTLAVRVNAAASGGIHTKLTGLADTGTVGRHPDPVAWINDERVDSGAVGKSINPATGGELGAYADGGAGEADCRHRRRQGGVHHDLVVHDRTLRAKVLNEMADTFGCQADDIAALLPLLTRRCQQTRHRLLLSVHAFHDAVPAIHAGTLPSASNRREKC